MGVIASGGIVLEWTDIVRTFVTVGIPALAGGFIKIIRLLSKIYKALETRIDNVDEKVHEVKTELTEVRTEVATRHRENKELIEKQNDVANLFVKAIGEPLHTIAVHFKSKELET